MRCTVTAVMLCALTSLGCSEPAAESIPTPPLVTIHTTEDSASAATVVGRGPATGLFVHRDPFLTDADFQSAQLSESDRGLVLAVHLTADAAARLAGVTSRNAGRPLVILVDTTMVGAPLVQAPLNPQQQQLDIGIAADLHAEARQKLRDRFHR